MRGAARRLAQSLSFRLALTYIALFCVSVAVLLGLYYWTSVAGPLDEIRGRIDRDARAMAQTYIVDGRDALRSALDERASRDGPEKAFHAFIDADGKVVTANLPSWPKVPTRGWLDIEADVNHEGGEIDYRALTRDRVFDDGARLLVGRDTEAIAVHEVLLGEAAAWIIGGTVLLGIAGGVFMSLAIHGRIEAVNRAALQVMAGDFSGRVPVRGTGDDFDRLGETLNLMLARIEELFEAVRRVSDNVSHELRTPLTRLLAQMERANAADADPERRHALMDAAIAEARRLHRIFDALLRIARIESGRHEPSMRRLDISALARDVAEFHAPDAESRGITLGTSIADGLAVAGDPDLLFQALSNLVDNALKYTPGGGRVAVTVEAANGRLSLSVSDDGPGLSPGEETRVTERFYRGDRTAGQAGEGLGLSLVKAVAALHKANLSFSGNRPGLVATISWHV